MFHPPLKPRPRLADSIVEAAATLLWPRLVGWDIMKKILLGLAALFALPGLTLVAFGLTGGRAPDDLSPGAWRFLSLSAMITAAYAAVLGVYVFLADRRLRQLERDGAALRGREHDLLLRLQDQHARIDTLSAAREVSLILNQDVDFKTILDKVLGITADLLGGKGSEEISIWLRAEDNGHLVSRARRGPAPGRDAAVTFDPDPGQPAPRVVADAYEHGRLITATSDIHLDVALPLVADREIVGVLLARAALEGEREEKAERARSLAGHLEEFAKVVALAIKTPDLYTRAVEDPLTRLATRRHFRKQLELHRGLAHRHGEPLSLIMIDIDHFKKINDAHGHLAGDAVLRGVADVIQGNLRRTDEAAYSAYRYGGEEMSVILPKTDMARAADAAERLRRQVEARRFPGAGEASLRVTISCGVAAMSADMASIDDLIAAADKALYAAKEAGRNRICVAEDGPRDKCARARSRAAH